MLSTLLKAFYQSLEITALIVLLLAGSSVVKDWLNMSHPFVISANGWVKVLVYCFLTVKLAVIVFSATAILHLLTGGGTNAH